MLKSTFGDENVLTQYMSEKYPFACDFYIKQLDLYIECNFHWTHAPKFGFFDKNNIDHINLLQKWKDRAGTNLKDFYNIAIKTWTICDVLKA